MRGIVSHVAKNGYYEAGEACLSGDLCVTSLLLCICYPSVVLLCGNPLLNVIYSFSSVGCIRWPGFALIGVSCRCVIDVMLLHCVCCTRLIRTLIICLFSELPSASARVRHTRFAVAAHPFKFQVSRSRTSQFTRCFLPAQAKAFLS